MPQEKQSKRKADPAPADSSVATDGADVARAAMQTVDVVRERIAQPAAAPQAGNFVSELNNIDFMKMIGGPLQAAVDAQIASSMATVNFIKQVGFTAVDPAVPGSKSELIMVDFSHDRKDVNPDGTDNLTSIAVKVPLLAMLPIPALRIEHVDINFNVKLNSVESEKVSDKLGVAAEVGGAYGPVNFKVSASYQRKTATNVEVKREYALSVNVKAVQDEMPAGLERILALLAA